MVNYGQRVVKLYIWIKKLVQNHEIFGGGEEFDFVEMMCDASLLFYGLCWILRYFGIYYNIIAIIKQEYLNL